MLLAHVLNHSAVTGVSSFQVKVNVPAQLCAASFPLLCSTEVTLPLTHGFGSPVVTVGCWNNLPGRLALCY